MYEATEKERKELMEQYGYKPEMIDALDRWSDDVRKGIPLSGILSAINVTTYQEALQAIRKSHKRWWQFWR